LVLGICTLEGPDSSVEGHGDLPGLGFRNHDAVFAGVDGASGSVLRRNALVDGEIDVVSWLSNCLHCMLPILDSCLYSLRSFGH
jgi:hypothetical protein